MMKLGRLALYGGGKMGMALLQGWLDSGAKPEQIAVYEPEPSLELKDTNVLINPANFAADVVFIAVKPQIMPTLLATTKFPTHALIVSVAAGVSLASFEKAMGKSARIIRAMPNTPAAVHAGITAIVGNKAATANDLSTAEGLLKSVGEVVRVDKESDMDAVTGLSGSGPAYVFYLIDAMAAAGEAQGLSPELAQKLALATVAGAGKLAMETGIAPAELRKNVTSPGGTTEAGLKILMDMKSGLEPLMSKTVAAATERSRALGREK